MVNALNLKEGGKVLLRLEGTHIVLESVQDPIELALHGKKFASTTPDRVEAISLEEQRAETEILLDTSFLLPTLGISVSGDTRRGIEILAETEIEIYYSRFSILESLWVATRTVDDDASY